MKHKKNILMIIIALVLVFALAACGQSTEKAVKSNNMDDSAKASEEPMESEDNDSIGHSDSDDDSDDDVIDDDSDDDDIDDDNDDDSMDDDKDMDDDNDDDSMANDPNRVFTLEELATFNGQNGQPAYVAVDGVVYDLTNSGRWKNGTHNGFTAGKDLTEEIKDISPHGVQNLVGIPIVGKLVEE